MTTKEAIRILDPETTAEALAEIEYYAGFSGQTAKVQAVNDACEIAVSALRDQQETGWISVKERLPEPEKTVLIYCRSQSSQWKYVCCGFYVPEGTYREDSGYTWDFECCDKYDEEKDDYQVRSGWYEAIHNWDDYSAVGVSDIVTHWMPLPEPPKEEV